MKFPREICKTGMRRKMHLDLDLFPDGRRPLQYLSVSVRVLTSKVVVERNTLSGKVKEYLCQAIYVIM